MLANAHWSHPRLRCHIRGSRAAWSVSVGRGAEELAFLVRRAVLSSRSLREQGQLLGVVPIAWNAPCTTASMLS